MALLALAAEPTQCNENGVTPLHCAARYGYDYCVRLLLDRGADPNLDDDDGRTPLCLAIQWDHAVCARLLIKHIEGSDPNKRWADKRYKDWCTLLHYAVLGSSAGCVKLLLEKGVKPNQGDKYGMTPLHYAVKYGYCDCVRLLLEKGADPNQIDNDLCTPLHYAAENERKYPNSPLASLLLAKGAERNLRNKAGKRPFDLAEEKLSSTRSLIFVPELFRSGKARFFPLWLFCRFPYVPCYYELWEDYFIK